ncbi:hypothetical protein [Halioxenophilus sp. WMMB6]|uniref:hypothetical protein n=1 Tax=Halioxenophilus sp. WMMB6 TaxID=3073815 RepID=UPI00295F50E1|nr:hypothetical protein [Halioxenophilus sp. WMMB6]
MPKHALAAGLCLLAANLFAAGVFADDCPLVGTWKSDKGKTIADVYRSKLPATAKTALTKMLGKMVVEYPDCTQASYTFEGQTTTSQLELVSYSGNTVILKDPTNGEESNIQLEGDCYSVVMAPLAITEYFCRVN